MRKENSYSRTSLYYGTSGRHLINPTTKYLGIQTTENYTHVNIVQEVRSDKPMYQKSRKVNKQRTLEKGYSIDISSMMYPRAGGKKHWL